MIIALHRILIFTHAPKKNVSLASLIKTETNYL